MVYKAIVIENVDFVTSKNRGSVPLSKSGGLPPCTPLSYA